MASTAVTLFTVLFSVLVPQKMWYAPSQPLTIKSDKDVTLELTDFSGKVIAVKGSADVSASQSADLKILSRTRLIRELSCCMRWRKVPRRRNRDRRRIFWGRRW